jgi:glutathione S-transferase
MLRILGRRTSSNVQKVLWVAGELGIPFEREDVGGSFGGNNTPDYLRLNPNGLVPTVIDGDLVLWESNSICRYLANRHGAAQLYPTAPGPRALVERWMDWQLSVVVPALVPLFITLIRTPEDKRDPAAIARLHEDAAAPFRILEAALDGRPYLEGDHLTLADIGVGIWTHRWFGLGYGEADSHLGAWYRRLGEHPAYREHVMIPLS